MANQSVLVTDANSRTGLAVIRSLGQKGIKVTAVADTDICSGFLSRYCLTRKRSPSPERTPSDFMNCLMKEIKQNQYDLIITSTEFTTILLSMNKKMVDEYCKVAVPEFDLLLKTMDKGETAKLANETNVPHPKTIIPSNIDDVREASYTIRAPIVIKPRIKTVLTDEGFFTMKVNPENYINNPADLVERYRKIIARYPMLSEKRILPLIQEYVHGSGYGFETVCSNGQCLASFMHKRIREYPITGGASTFRTSIFRQDIAKMGERILSSLKWTGPAMVEFKIDEIEQAPRLIEINGRLWGSVPLAIAAGVDIPYLTYQLFTGGLSNCELGKYRLNVKSHWTIPGEVLWFVSAMQKLDFRGVLKFLGSYSSSNDDIFSFNDASPAIGAIMEMIPLVSDVLSNRRTMSGELV